MPRFTRLLGLIAVCLVAACGGRAERGAPDLPVTQWDFRPDAEALTGAALAALATHGAALPAGTPADVRDWCPAYLRAGPEDRAAFWTGFLSALAKYESTWNPQAVGGGGQWFGLTQISPATARGYGCRATTGNALLDGPANLSCAIRIMAVTVPRDGVIAAGRGGVAADWAPLLSTSKRQSMQAWTAAQPYCR
ncbi:MULTISPECIES: transglycosylase SLT domain-containing protein [unclassified Dinoroseobacter]|uniref:transglycosylase SLT domain-containing protein n=1 Tax=unclassified Dinoroseobacter TaxID=2620028 RepID=UPI003C7CBE5D